MQNKKIILASASPRRKELLEKIGLKFDVMPSDIEELLDNDYFSKEKIEKLALDKALNVSSKINFPAIIIGSDTVVVIDNKILGKPKDENEAFIMLRMLSGKTHQVVSAIAIIDTETHKTDIDSVSSDVTFRKINDTEIKKYISTGEPLDKAGAYAIQGVAGIFISKICGCYTNIVGISVYKTAEMLKKFGIDTL